MEHKIPTLYSSFDEAMLDIEIYGRKVLSPHLSIPELRDRLFEDFQRSKPLPTLTSKRYELSRLVSEDYKILYIKELELKANEHLTDLRENKSRSKAFNFNFDNLEPIASNIQTMFTYESRTRDIDRENILAKYDLFSGEEFQRGIAETEKIFNSVVEDTSLVKTDEEIEQMGKLDESSQIPYMEEEDSFSVDESELSDSVDVEDDDDGYYPESYDEEDEEAEEAEEVGDEDDDGYYPDSYDEEDEEAEEVTETEDDDDGYYSDSHDEEEDDDGYYPDTYEDDDDDVYYPDSYDEEGVSDASDNNSFVEETISPIASVDEDFSNFDMEFEEEKLELPKTPVELGVVKPVEEKFDRSAEPTDLRQFLRKYPRSSMEFVSKYFTKKQINDALRQGKIIKRGNTLRLP